MSRLAKWRRGQGTIEFALALPIFVMVFFAIVEFTHLFYVQLTLQHAIREAGRYMVTGRTEKDPSNPDKNLSRNEVIKAVFCKNLIGTGLSCPALGDPEFRLSPSDGGGPGDPVTVTANFEKAPFTSLVAQFFTGGKANFTVSTTWVNEPFSTT